MNRNHATYKKIQEYVRKKHGRTVKSCWIVHVKEICGLEVSKSPRRKGQRLVPCPSDKRPWIKDAFKQFNMI